MTNIDYTTATPLFLADLATRTKSKETVTNYRIVLNGFGEWLSSAEQTKEICPDTIAEWRQYAGQTRGVKNNTIRHYMMLLRVFFKWCERKGYLDSNPIQEEDLPLAEQIRHDIPTLDEVSRLLSGELPKYTPKPVRERNKAIITLYLQSGVRVGELVKMRIGDLDFERNLITVNWGKGNKQRCVPFPCTAQETVKAYLKVLEQNGADISPNTILFRGWRTNADKPLSRQNITIMVKGYVKRLTGHKDIGSHDLRHAAASLWDDLGVPIRTVQKALGHASVQTTENVYVQILDKSKAAMDISGIIEQRTLVTP